MRRTLITVASSALLFAGCASTPDEQPTATQAAPASAASAASEAPRAQARPADRRAAAPAAPAVTKGVDGMPHQRTIYYDYDQFDIRADYRKIVEAHAQYLRDNPGAKMTIEGNADERGSREYNVGLGQRRSGNVEKTLQLLGAKESQVESVSLGEEKPACTDHAENCWWKNRRGDIRYVGK